MLIAVTWVTKDDFIAMLLGSWLTSDVIMNLRLKSRHSGFDWRSSERGREKEEEGRYTILVFDEDEFDVWTRNRRGLKSAVGLFYKSTTLSYGCAVCWAITQVLALALNEQLPCLGVGAKNLKPTEQGYFIQGTLRKQHLQNGTSEIDCLGLRHQSAGQLARSVLW